jgi:formyl-CoA transferase
MQDPVRGETIQIGFPAKFSDDLDFKRFPAPFFGEHTREVLMSLGYNSTQIEKLQDEGVI